MINIRFFRKGCMPKPKLTEKASIEIAIAKSNKGMNIRSLHELVVNYMKGCSQIFTAVYLRLDLSNNFSRSLFDAIHNRFSDTLFRKGFNDNEINRILLKIEIVCIYTLIYLCYIFSYKIQYNLYTLL